MRRKTLRVILLSLLWVIGLTAIAAGGFYWRLNRGPVSLAVLGTTIEDAINKQLPGFRISLGDTELELDADTGEPTVRAQNLILKSAEGEIIASAPKAGVSLSTSKLLLGSVGVESLELIGPRVNARINLDGTLQLGIANDAAAVDQEVTLDDSGEPAQPDGKGDMAAPTPAPPAADSAPATSPLTSGKQLLALLDAGGNGGLLSKLEEVRISRAVVQLYDEANDASWQAPRADLAFRRVPSGFVVAAKASIASRAEPWTIEASATYRRDSSDYIANVAVENVVPAHVAEKIFALSQFARVNIPFSGHFEINAQDGGIITKAEGQLFASAGQVNLPDYLAKPIVVDEGSMRVAYNGPGTPLEILESSILMGSSRADVKGKFTPQRADDGRLQSLAFELNADNVAVDAQGTVKDPVFVDKVSLVGRAAVDEQRVDINDLVVMAGNTGVRLRGVITGGDDSPGIEIAGRLRDVSADLLKKLWPPIVAPRSRAWINENIVSGRITEGQFAINFPANQLAAAQREKKLPDGAVDMSFSMADVTSRYFKNLPVLQNGDGNATLKGDSFTLNITRGGVTLPSGRSLSLASGYFNARDLLAVEVPGVFKFDIRGAVDSLVEFAASPDLKLVTADFQSMPKIEGTAQALVGLQLPLIKDVPRSRVAITTDIKLSDAAVKGIMPGIDLTGGQFAVAITSERLSVKGPAKVNNVAANVEWSKQRGSDQSQATVATTLDAKMRSKLGLKLDDYMTGDVPVRVTITDQKGKGRTIDVEADLSTVAMNIRAAGWSRAPVKGTTATFRLVDNGKDGKRVENLAIDGSGLRLRGSVAMRAGGGLSRVDLSEIRLTGDDVFAARLEPGDGTMNLTLSGTSFDARPYIKNLVTPARTDGAAAAQGGTQFIVNASFDEITAHRGEVVRNVKAKFVSRGGTIGTATIDGVFASGLPVNVRVTPTAGGREMRVATADGGAALRAANFYSKIAGGELEFYALMANAPGSPVRNGILNIRRFEVRNEATLAELDSRGRPKKSGPRAVGVSFKRLTLPFTTDAKFVRLCKVELRGNDLGGVAEGLIRKADGAIDITGTMIPAQGLNSVLSGVPLVGDLLGGKEGIFGVTFAMGGTIAKPRTQVNPLSALAPGFLRKAFEFQGTCGGRPTGQRQFPIGTNGD